jgi:hypothetical protein
MWTGGSEVVEGRDEEPEAKWVLCEQVKLPTVTVIASICLLYQVTTYRLPLDQYRGRSAKRRPGFR